MSTRFPVTNKAAPKSVGDFSGTMVANQPKTIFAAFPEAIRYLIQNLSQADNLWISEIGVPSAGPGSICILPGACYESDVTAFDIKAFATAPVPYTAVRYS